MLRRIKSPFKKLPENSDLKYLQFTQGYNYEENGEDDCDDASSISSVSTNATMDNIPGTGRIIDKCIYQFFGRKLERAIFRISMANLSPDRILQFLRKGRYSVYMSSRTSRRLDYVIQEIEGNERIAGLKSLVKQTQSDSLYRSAAALSALIRLSTTYYLYNDFYVSVAAVEPIFHLESLANALDDSHPEKKYFLFLIGIARTRLHCVNNDCGPEITEEFAINCRQKLLDILDSSRSPCHDPFVLVADVCLLLADVFPSFYDRNFFYDSPSPAAHSLIETAHFILTFLVRFLIDQFRTINNMHPLQRLILLTYSRWLDYVTNYIIYGLKWLWDLPQLLPICAFSILRRIIGNMQHGSCMPQGIDSLNVFPRRIRSSTLPGDDPIIFQSFLNICTRRTCRLLASPDELRREAGNSMRLEYGSRPDGLYNLPFAEKLMEEWQRSLGRAQSIPVVENDLTREFLEARQVMHGDPTNVWNWAAYTRFKRTRHIIGEYCRSNLDWDWDPSSCLKRLFRIDRPKNSSRPEGAVHQGDKGVPTIHRGTNGGTLAVSIPGKAPNVLEKVVQIRYETEAGEVRYKTFYAGPSVEDVTTCADGGTRTHSSSGQEADSLNESLNETKEVPEAGSQDEMKNTEVEDEIHEEVRWLRKQNGASDTEDDNASVDTTNRPQYNTRTDEWLETQVCVTMDDG